MFCITLNTAFGGATIGYPVSLAASLKNTLTVIPDHEYEQSLILKIIPIVILDRPERRRIVIFTCDY